MLQAEFVQKMYNFVLLLLLSLIHSISSTDFENFGTRGKKLAETGGIQNLEKAITFFKKQRKSAKSKRQAFTATNNVAVTRLRLGNLKRPASRAVEDYKVALQSWRKCLKLNSKSKKVLRNLQLLDDFCRRRYHGAPSCDEALTDNSVYQQNPKFLRSMYKGNLEVDVDVTGTLQPIDRRKHIYATSSLLITKGMKHIRSYKQQNVQEEENNEDGAGANLNGDKLPKQLGDALFAFTQASALHHSEHNNQENEDNEELNEMNDSNDDGVLDYIIATNNVAAIYLTMAGNTLGSNNMDRSTIDHAVELVEEAQRVLQRVKLFEHTLDQTDSKALTTSVTNNHGIVERIKLQIQGELKELRNGVPTTEELAKQNQATKEDGTKDGTKDGTEDGTEGDTETKKKTNFPSVDKIHWPPSKSHLKQYGFRSIPSVGAYVRQRNTPVVITGTNQGKRKIDVWNLQSKWSNTKYLEENLKPIVLISMTKSAENLYGTDQMDKRMNIHEFFARLHYMNETGGTPYDGLHPYVSLDIDADHVSAGSELMDDLVNTNFQDVSAGYFPIGKQMKLILWIGASNVSAVGHYDHAYNCFLMLRGSKRFIVAPPSSSIDLYFHPAPSHSHRQSQMRHFDRINNTMYSRASKVPFQEANVQPGEIMYLPPLWIHNVISTSGPSVALSAWSYPGKVLSCIDELSNDFRKPTNQLLALYIDGTSSRSIGNKLHLATYATFIVRVLLKVFDSQVNYNYLNSVGDGSASAFVEGLLESKYNNKDSEEAGCTAKSTCPTIDDYHLIPSLLEKKIEEESVRRAIMLGSRGIEESPLGSLLESGAHVPLIMASVEYLSHVSQSFGRTIGHGDEAGKKVCHFIRNCILPRLKEAEEKK